ncbi:MAG: hypothetical protein JWO45_2008, partial [Spartobacteria bacterium]|nr:hypothetical protein [Spartobacteria bacterium]
ASAPDFPPKENRWSPRKGAPQRKRKVSERPLARKNATLNFAAHTSAPCIRRETQCQRVPRTRADAARHAPTEQIRSSFFTPARAESPLRPLLDRNHLLAYRHADVLAQRAVKTVVFQLLEDVRAPTGCARDCEHRGKEISRNAK